ncbi:hypothetical protein GCM10027578_33890 [Spirosoma luteolum]
MVHIIFFTYLLTEHRTDTNELTQMKTKPTICLNALVAPALLIVTLLATPVRAGIDTQVPAAKNSVATSLAYKPAGSDNKSALLARNTPAKSEATTAAPAAAAKTHDKKAIGRCWSRIMTMVREINLAHRNRSK